MKRALIAAGVLLVASGCATRGHISQSSRLADAGIAYGEASVEVIALTRDRYLSWSADSLVDEAGDLPHCTSGELSGEASPTSSCEDMIAQFDEAFVTYTEFIDRLTALQLHAEAVSRYFQALKTLTEFDGNSSAASAAGRLVDRINSLSGVLEPDAQLSDEQRASWSAMAGVVGDKIKATRLRARLEADAVAIARAIDVQDGVLNASAAAISAIDRSRREVIFQRDVRAKYVLGNIEDSAKWKSDLRASLLPGPDVAPLRTLQAASAGLREVWEGMLSGTGSPDSAQAVIDDIEKSLQAIDGIRQANAKRE